MKSGFHKIALISFGLFVLFAINSCKNKTNTEDKKVAIIDKAIQRTINERK